MGTDAVLIDHAVGQAWEEPQVWAQDERPDLQAQQPAQQQQLDGELKMVRCQKCGDTLVEMFAHEHNC